MSGPIRIYGFSASRKKANPSSPRIKFTSPVRLRSMLWVPTLFGLAYGAHEQGTPHVLFQYTYVEFGSQRYYTVCDYIGLHSQRIYPKNGDCPPILFLKPREETDGK